MKWYVVSHNPEYKFRIKIIIALCMSDAEQTCGKTWHVVSEHATEEEAQYAAVAYRDSWLREEM